MKIYFAEKKHIGDCLNMVGIYPQTKEPLTFFLNLTS